MRSRLLSAASASASLVTRNIAGQASDAVPLFRGVTLDCMGTLLLPTSSISAKYAAAAAECGPRVGVPAINRPGPGVIGRSLVSPQ
jgi:hypothetical protein